MLTLQKSFNLGSSLATNRSVHYFFFEKTSSSTQEIAIDEPTATLSGSVRVVDPDGEILHWSVLPVSQERFNIAGSAPVTTSVIRHTVTLPEKTGIYKIAVKNIDSNQIDVYADFSITSYGIWNPGGNINQNSIDFSPGYIFAPAENPDYGFVATGDVTVRQSDSTVIPETENSSGGIDLAVNPTFGSDDVWTIETSGTWSLSHQGQPFCVCNSLAAANAIQSGTTKPGGIRFWSKGDELAHGRIISLLEKVEKSPSIGNAIKTWDLAVTEWEKNVPRYHEVRTYANAFRTIHTAIKQQNVESSDYRAGMMNESLLSSSTGMIARGEPGIERGAFFGFLAAWNDPTNPYYNTDDMKARAQIAMHADFRHVQGRRVQGSRSDISDRLGNIGLAGSSDLGMSLYFNNEIGNIESEDLDALMVNIADHLDSIFGSIYTSTRNQDAGVLPLLVMAPIIWQMKYGNDNLKPVCIHEADGIANPNPTFSGATDVALPEAVSYDGSYSGIQNFNLATAYILSNRAQEWRFLRDSCERNYRFFSQFVSPTKETYKGIYAYDSDSRTSLGAINEQFDGAVDKLCDEVPVIGRFAGLRGLFEDSRADAEGLTAYANLINSEVNGNLDNQVLWEIHTGWKFQVVSLWTAALENLTNPRAFPLPCEIPSDGVVITDDNDTIEINTPWYYASIPTYFPGEFYWRFNLEQYETPRAFDSIGGAWLDEPYPMTSINDKRGVDCEEIGGSGLSMLYSKKAGRPVITGRNILPITTHQIIGITSGGKRRWALPSSRTYATGPNTVVIEYSIYGNDNFEQGDVDIRKTLTFFPASIRVENQVTRKVAGDVVELYETIPMTSLASFIGSQSRSQMIQTIVNPRSAINSIGDGINIRGEMLATPFIEFTSSSEAITYARMAMPLPTGLEEVATASYTIEMPFDPDTDVDFEEISASTSPTRPRNRRRTGVIKDSPVFFKVNNRTFSLQNSGNSRVNNQIPTFDRRAVIELSYLLDNSNSFSEIRYTINGSEPTKRSSLYSQPIILDSSISGNETVSLKAKVFEKESITSGKLLEFRFKIK